MAEAPPPRQPPENEVRAAETPTGEGSITLAVAIAIIAALYFGREVFLPIVLAVLLSFVLAPLVDLLRKLKIGRIAAVVATILVALTVILSLGGVIGLQLADLGSELPRYEVTVREKLDGLRSGTVGRLSGVVRHLGREINNAAQDPAAKERAAAPAEEAKPTPVEVREPEPTPIVLAQRFLAPVLQPLATTGIVLIVCVFILLQREDLRDRMIRLFGARDLHKTTIAMDDAARRLSRYFLTQLGLNAVFGILISTGLWAIGVPSPVLWGVFAALMRFVPYIGAFVAALLPMALAAAVDPGWSMLLWTAALFLVTEPVMGQVVEPLVYGHSTGLSPFAVLVAAIFWTWLWGPIGLVLATPLTVCLVVLGRHVERLEFLDVLLGDRPALTPVENFYQRLLADDPDEALEHAEQLLKERSLSSYYDEVALKGLQLAVNDAQRDVLTKGQLARMKDGIQALVADLSVYDDVEPPAKEAPNPGPGGLTKDEQKLPKVPPVPETAPPEVELASSWRSEAPILCVAGRGPLDEAASEMLAQLVSKHGLCARVVPHEAVSRTNVETLDVSGVAMVCVSYLDISGNPAHLRYLLKRLRSRVPNAPILVGLWPADDAVLTDPELRGIVGADYYVTSLRDAVAACMEAAKKASEAEEGKGVEVEVGAGDAARRKAASAAS
jgi:predicted PurR-regulated permease PerM